MVADQMVWKQRLTGRTRYRLTFFGKVVLQVEVAHQSSRMNPFSKEYGPVYTTWRDATMADMRFDLDALNSAADSGRRE